MSSKKIDVDLILDLSEQGKSIKEVAEAAKCGQRTVSTIRRENGFRSPRLLSAERVALISEKLDDGWSIAEIARTFGHDPKNLRKQFPGRGWSREQMNEFNHILRVARENAKAAA